MGCLPKRKKSKSKVEEAVLGAEYLLNEEEMLGPASKVRDASEHANDLIQESRVAIELKLSCFCPTKEIKATEMITRHIVGSINHSLHASAGANTGTMYYIKVKLDNREWPWCFVKLYEPPNATDENHVMFRGIRKMHIENDLFVF